MRALEQSDLSLASPRRRRIAGTGKAVLRFAARKPMGMAGAVVLLIMVITAVVGPFVAPYDPTKMQHGFYFRPPSRAFLMGTDSFGRDVLSRVVAGARISIYVSLSSVIVGTGLGAVWGLFNAYFRGWFDLISQRLIEIKMGFPTLVLAMAMVAMLGPSLTNVVIAIAITLIPPANRVVRSQALAQKETMYVDAARAIGASHLRIIRVHIAPQCVAPFLIVATASLGTALLMEASLGFLGLGVPPPTPTWGAMLNEQGSRYMERAPWLAIFPGLAITLVVLGVNLFGDALRDILDPRLRGSQ